MKYILALILLALVGCEMPEPAPPPPKVWKPVVVKKKYSENQVTKDIVFGTGNWHSTEYFIVDKNNKIWNGISQQDFILCDVGDTLWSDDGLYLQLKK